MEINIKRTITPKEVRDLMITFIESGHSNFWCNGVNIIAVTIGLDTWTKGAARKHFRCPDNVGWYANEAVYAADGYVIEIGEDDGEPAKKHLVGASDLARGFEVMSVKYPKIWADFAEDNHDANTADIWIQCALFGEEKYC